MPPPMSDFRKQNGNNLGAPAKWNECETKARPGPRDPWGCVPPARGTHRRYSPNKSGPRTGLRLPSGGSTRLGRGGIFGRFVFRR